jgi:type VI protein secretion system component Hcp
VILSAAVALIVGLLSRGPGDALAALPKSQVGFLELFQSSMKQGGSPELIDGGSTDRHHKGWIDVTAYKASFHGGPPYCDPIAVKTGQNPSWPIIAGLAASSGGLQGQAHLEITRRADTRDPIVKYDLSSPSIKSVDEEDSSETIQIAFDHVHYAYQTLKPDGRLGPVISRDFSCT